MEGHVLGVHVETQDLAVQPVGAGSESAVGAQDTSERVDAGHVRRLPGVDGPTGPDGEPAGTVSPGVLGRVDEVPTGVERRCGRVRGWPASVGPREPVGALDGNALLESVREPVGVDVRDTGEAPGCGVLKVAGEGLDVPRPADRRVAVINGLARPVVVRTRRAESPVTVVVPFPLPRRHPVSGRETETGRTCDSPTLPEPTDPYPLLPRLAPVSSWEGLVGFPHPESKEGGRSSVGPDRPYRGEVFTPRTTRFSGSLEGWGSRISRPYDSILNGVRAH